MDLDEKRKKRNEDLVKRLKAGETTQLIPTHMTWFPPRPSIQKNKDAINRLYAEKKNPNPKSKKNSIEIVKSMVDNDAEERSDACEQKTD